jgi:hypothetical protein
VLAAHFCLDIPSTAAPHEKPRGRWDRRKEQDDRQGNRRCGPFAAGRWRGGGDGRARRRSESLGCCQRLFGGVRRRGDAIWRDLRVRVGRGRAVACAGPQVCEDLRGATRGVGRIGACNHTGALCQGLLAFLAEKERWAPWWFRFEPADKKQSPKRASGWTGRRRDVTGHQQRHRAPLSLFPTRPGHEGVRGRVFCRFRGREDNIATI